MKSFLYIPIWFVVLSSIGLQTVFAAEMFVDSQATVFAVDGGGSVDVFLRTDGEYINAVEGTVVFPTHVDLEDVWSGSSAISLWVEPPFIEENSVYFSGVVPGGVSSQDGLLLFTVLFRGNRETAAPIVFKNVRVLLGDGNGTEVYVDTIPFNLKTSSTVPSMPQELNDIFPPEMFTVAVSKDETLFNGSYFAVFAARDNESGIDYYEIQESKDIEPDDAAWKQASSPYMLSDQSLNSHIFVKAVDKKGNVRVSVYEPDIQYSLQIYFVYGVMLLVVIYAILYAYGKKR